MHIVMLGYTTSVRGTEERSWREREKLLGTN
jgi:hypothetical protein